MYLSRRGSLAKSGAGDQATRIDVRLKGVAEIVSSALGGSREGGGVSACECGKGQGEFSHIYVNIYVINLTFRESFLCECSLPTNPRKFSPSKVSRYTVFLPGPSYMYMYMYMPPSPSGVYKALGSIKKAFIPDLIKPKGCPRK